MKPQLLNRRHHALHWFSLPRAGAGASRRPCIRAVRSSRHTDAHHLTAVPAFCDPSCRSAATAANISVRTCT